MIYGIKLVVSYFLGTDVVGRRVAVHPDDTFLVSYPRSGNTWTRFLIANLLHPETEVTFANIERLIPDTSSQSSLALKRTPRPRYIKSHEYFDHRYPRVLYIVREPRDVALSYYNFSRKYLQIPDDYPLETYISDFVNRRLISAPWGTWGENVGTWLAARQGKPDFLLVRYEDLTNDTAAELSKIADFLRVNCSSELIERSLRLSAADNMRKMEHMQSNDWVATKGKRSDIPFVGNAEVGGWKARLPSNSIREIEAAWGDVMLRLGYSLSPFAPDSTRLSSQSESTSRILQAVPHSR